MNDRPGTGYPFAGLALLTYVFAADLGILSSPSLQHCSARGHSDRPPYAVCAMGLMLQGLCQFGWALRLRRATMVSQRRWGKDCRPLQCLLTLTFACIIGAA